MNIVSTGAFQKTDNGPGPGHSIVRFPTTIDLGDGVKRPVELIFSTPDLAIIDAFPRGGSFVAECEIAAAAAPVVQQSSPPPAP